MRRSATASLCVVLLVCGMCGFLVGLLHPGWHEAVEGGQVAAGLVSYPPENPNGLFLRKEWTLLHQVTGALLSWGVSEHVLSWLLSGLLTALAFQSMGLCVWALSGAPVLSVLSPFAIAYAAVFDSGDLGYPSVAYGIGLTGGPYTNGFFGFYGLLLVLGLMAAGRPHWGIALLGPLTALHPALGVWGHLIVLACAVVDWRTWGRILRDRWAYAVAGYLVCAASLWRYLGAMGPAPPPSGNTAELLAVFLRDWDYHRWSSNFIVLANPALPLAGLTLFISLAWLRPLGKDLASGSPFLLRAFIAAGLLGAGLSLIGWFCPGEVPQLALRFMPMRLLELDVLALPVLVLGFLGRYRENGWARAVLGALAAALLLPSVPPRYVWFVPAAFALLLGASAEDPVQLRRLLRVAGAFLLAGGALALCGRSVRPTLWGFYSPGRLAGAMVFLACGAACLSAGARERPFAPFDRRFGGSFRAGPPPWVPRLLFGLVAVMVFIRGLGVFMERREFFRDWSNDPFWREVHRSPGMILTSPDIDVAQLRGRRPVLLNYDEIDRIPYVPEAAPGVNRILKAVYGVDILAAPDDIRSESGEASMRENERGLWERRPAAEWAGIGREFGVSAVLTSAGWRLKLPEAARSREFVLYAVPPS